MTPTKLESTLVAAACLLLAIVFVGMARGCG